MTTPWPFTGAPSSCDIGDKQGQASTLRYLEELYGAAEESRALGCYYQSLALAREIGHPYTEAQVLISLGGFFRNQQSARGCFEDALVLAQRMKLLSLVQSCSRALYGLYKSQHDFEQALNHLETLHETTQVLTDERAIRPLHEINGQNIRHGQYRFVQRFRPQL